MVGTGVDGGTGVVGELRCRWWAQVETESLAEKSARELEPWLSRLKVSPGDSRLWSLP